MPNFLYLYTNFENLSFTSFTFHTKSHHFSVATDKIAAPSSYKKAIVKDVKDKNNLFCVCNARDVYLIG